MESAATVVSASLAAAEASTISTPEVTAAMRVSSVASAEPFVAAEPATVPAAFAAKPFATPESTTAMPFAFAAEITPAPKPIVVTVPTPIIVATPTVVAVSTVIAASAVVAIEPGAGADKHAADKVIGTVVAVGRAIIRIVIVVAIRTNRRRPVVFRSYIHGTESDSDVNLRLRGACRYYENPEQQSVL